MKLKAILPLLLVANLLGCSSCQTTTGGNTQVKQVLANAEKVIGPAAVDYLATETNYALNGNKITTQQAVQQAAVVLWQNIDKVKNASDAKTLTEQAGIQGLSSVVQTAFKKATTGDKTAATNAIAAVLSSMAGAPPSPSTVK